MEELIGSQQPSTKSQKGQSQRSEGAVSLGPPLTVCTTGVVVWALQSPTEPVTGLASRQRECKRLMVYPNIALDTDHRPVTTSLNKVRQPAWKRQEMINLRKLDDPDIREKVKQEMYESLQSPPIEWLIFKLKLTQVPKSACGLKKVGPKAWERQPTGGIRVMTCCCREKEAV